MTQIIICVLLWIVGAAYTSFNEPAPQRVSRWLNMLSLF